MVRPITYADTVLAVHRANHLLGGDSTAAILIVAWPDGHVVWSRDRVKGGAPYYAGHVDPRSITALLGGFHKEGVFASALLSRCHVEVFDSIITIILLRFGTWALEMMSDHEFLEQLRDRPGLETLAKETNQNLLYRLIWSETRRSLDELIPATGERIDGAPVMRSGILSWYEPDRDHDSRRAHSPPESLWLEYEAVSEALRRALEEGRWPLGRGIAIGIGPDGAEYDVDARNGRVYIQEWDPTAGGWIAIAEPEGVVWKPVFAPPERVGGSSKR